MTIVRDSFYINGEWVKATSTETIDVTSRVSLDVALTHSPLM